MKPAALTAFEEVVGKEFIITGAEQLHAYGRDTIMVTRSMSAVLKPGRVEEIQEVVRIANRYGISLYPISTGRNWGYGSSNPVRDHNVILDLSRMNRIVHVDPELAYAVVEPGVSQGQLCQYLRLNHPGLMLDPTGSSPACSILGNSVERGYGISPYGDHFASMCGMDVVLASGELLRTGFGHFRNAKAAYTFRYGIGPFLDGIFTQSNFGIVTRIGVWLMPVPEAIEACYFMCEKASDFGPLADSVRWLLLHGVIRSSVNLVHRNRVLTMLGQHPWDDMGNDRPVKEEILVQRAKAYNIGTWNGMAGLYGTTKEVRAAKAIIKRKLRGKVSRLRFVSDRLLDGLERVKTGLRLLTGIDVTELLRVLKPSYGILKGIPSEASLAMPYWRMRIPIPPSDRHPARDNCGIYWISPVLPLRSASARDFLDGIAPIFQEHRFDLCPTFTCVNPRTFDCTLPILYNKDDADETLRASECYRAVFKACLDGGYVPYRVGIQSMSELVAGEDVFWDVVQRLKTALDPMGILAPGRYSR